MKSSMRVAILGVAFWAGQSLGYLATAQGADNPNGAKGAIAELKAASKSPAVVKELETMGVSYDGDDPDNWKVFAIGYGSYEFNDPDNRRDAAQEAILKAKSALAKFVREQIATEEQRDTLVENKKQQERAKGKESISVSSDRTESTLEKIHNQAEMVLTGIIVLDVTFKPDGDSYTATAKVGQSQKSLDAAKRFRTRTAAAQDDEEPKAAEAEDAKGSSGDVIIHMRNKSDF